MDLADVGVYSTQLRFGDQSAAADAAAELEGLGYSAVWLPDAGGPVFEAADNLLAATESIVVATGVLNLWMHAPLDVAANFASLSSTHGSRFLLGIGVSHAPVVDATESGRYRKPLSAMDTFLDELDNASEPVPVADRALAALGPKMLEMAAARSRGAVPYLVTAEHTRQARETLGAEALLLPEQTVILSSDPDEVYGVGTEWLRRYLTRPNYANSIRRMGFSEADIAAVSNRLVDAIIAWGDEDAIRRRLDDHFDAGADHVSIQVVTGASGALPLDEWRRLAVLTQR